MSECSRCGDCCKIIPIANVRGMDPRQKNYLLVHGCRIEHGTMLIPLTCPHLIEDESGICTCDIQETKPQTCKDFDGRPISHGRKYFIPDRCSMARKK